jgi:putative endonuclease
MAYVYILYSDALDKFYIGHTEQSPEERLKKHLSNHDGFTARAKDWKLVYSEFYDTKQMASKRENQIKSWKSKAAIQKLIKDRF